ncbi:MAG TPA: cellulose binding domain-containing protein [Clostridia bacterium]|nr:cellulose binding domain-containing protein [Clostridia bacterium]
MYNADTNGFTNTISPRFKIVNTGKQPVKLSDIKVRYYFTVDDEKQQSFSCDYSSVGNSNVTRTFVKMPGHLTTADCYFELGFSSSGTIATNSSVEVQSRIYKTDWSNYTQTNDYSFNSNDTNYTDFDKVAAYIGRGLLGGKKQASADFIIQRFYYFLPYNYSPIEL